MAKISASRREAGARAAMKLDGFEFAGVSLIAEAKAGNPRALYWVQMADAVLTARPTKAIRRAVEG